MVWLGIGNPRESMKGPAGPFINNPQGPKRLENDPVDHFQ